MKLNLMVCGCTPLTNIFIIGLDWEFFFSKTGYFDQKLKCVSINHIVIFCIKNILSNINKENCFSYVRVLFILVKSQICMNFE